MSETIGIDFFERVKGILKDKILPVLPGDAKTFRENINKAIGTEELPEIIVDEQGVEHISKDGAGMSGAIYAMGEAVRDGLDEAKKATIDAINATAAAKAQAEEAEKQASAAKAQAEEAKKQASAAKTATQKVQNVVDQAAEIASLRAQAGQAIADAESAIDAVTGKVNNFLIVSTANENGRPFDTKGEQVDQMFGGVWFQILSNEAISYGGSTTTDNSTTQDAGE